MFLDPDSKEPTCADGKDAFIVDLIPKEEFKKRWPKAKVTDFTTEMQEAAPSWIREAEIQVAEYWKVEETDRKLNMVQTPSGPVEMWADQTPARAKILRDRMSKTRKVVQYMTNGIEVLEENDLGRPLYPHHPGIRERVVG